DHAGEEIKGTAEPGCNAEQLDEIVTEIAQFEAIIDQHEAQLAELFVGDIDFSSSRTVASHTALLTLGVLTMVPWASLPVVWVQESPPFVRQKIKEKLTLPKAFLKDPTTDEYKR